MKGFGATLKKIGKILILLVVAVLIIHSTLLIVWGRQLDRALAEIKSRGEPVNVADLAPKPISDSDNAARLYEQASAISRIWDNSKSSRTICDYYAAKTADEREKLAPEARKSFAAISTAFRLIDEAESRPKCVFKGTPDSAYIPGDLRGSDTLGTLRGVSYLLCAHAVFCGQNGQMDDALRDIDRNLRLGKHAAQYLRQPPNGQLLQLRFIGSSIAALTSISGTHPLTSAQSRRVFDDFGNFNLQPASEQALRGERAEFSSEFDAARRDLTSYITATGGGVPSFRICPIYRPWPENGASEPKPVGRLTSVSDSIVSYLWKPFSYRDQLEYIRLFNQEQKVVQLPYREAVKILRKQPISSYARITKLPGYGPFTSTQRLRDLGIAQIGLCRTAMAVFAFRDSFGRYPVDMPELTKRLRWPLLDDPFSGRPFIYRPGANGFTLYTIGTDLKDDGGKPIFDGRHGDIVEKWGKQEGA